MGKRKMHKLTFLEKKFLRENSAKFTIEEMAQNLHCPKSNIRRFLNYYNLNYKHVKKPYRIDLTAREKEIMCLLVEGFKLTSIAKKLNIANTTINTHIMNIRSKLGINAEPAKNLLILTIFEFMKGKNNEKI